MDIVFRKKKYLVILFVAVLLLISVSALFYWRSTHVPIFPDTDGRALSITAYWSSCCYEYRKDLTAMAAVDAAMEQLRQLTYNPHKEDIYGPKPGGRVLRLAIQYEGVEEPQNVSLIEGGTVVFLQEGPTGLFFDDPQYCMPVFSVEALWDSFDAPKTLVWEYVREERHDP